MGSASVLSVSPRARRPTNVSDWFDIMAEFGRVAEIFSVGQRDLDAQRR